MSSSLNDDLELSPLCSKCTTHLNTCPSRAHPLPHPPFQLYTHPPSPHLPSSCVVHALLLLLLLVLLINTNKQTHVLLLYIMYVYVLRVSCLMYLPPGATVAASVLP